jgi:translation initiation factor IF-2
MSMRVYELAKRLGLENKTLLSELKKMGVSVASHSSALDDDIAQKVLTNLLRAPRAEEKPARGLRHRG